MTAALTLRRDEKDPRWFGLYRATVANPVDPLNQGRVRVAFVAPGSRVRGQVEAWATLLTPDAGDGQGFQTMPDVGAQVMIAFEAGDPNRPCVVGACWGAGQTPPEVVQTGHPVRTWTSRAGSVLRFDDAPGAARVTIATPGGQRLVLDEAADEVVIEHRSGCRIRLTSSGEVVIDAGSALRISASTVKVDAGMVKCSGVLKCDTLIANSVVASSYTPGAGNVW